MIAQDLGLVTAYAYAVSQGYTGTEEEFAELMASYATVAERAEAAATAAETAQGKAEDAQTAAEGAQTAAETAQGKAEDAQGYAEAAETAAETAQGKAEDAQTAAEGAQTAAETAQGKAEAAQTAAEGAQTAAESAQGYAEGYATAASGSASASSTQALKSEGYAVGTQDGTPVASGSPYYEYNSKYFADLAAEVAKSIPEDYSKLSENVSDLKSTIDQLATFGQVVYTTVDNDSASVTEYKENGNRGYIGNTGNFTASNTYATFLYNITVNGYVWFSETSGNKTLAVFTTNQIGSANFVARYRTSDGNLPDAEHKLAVTAGQMVAIGVSVSASTERYNTFLLNVPELDLTIKLTNDVNFNTKQDTDIANIAAQVKKTAGTIAKSGTDYVITNGNARYTVRRFDRSDIRAYLWRIYKCEIADGVGGWCTVSESSDADGVIQITGEDDFIGGYHGDETETDFSVYVDGVLQTETEFDKSYQTIEIYQESDVYHCNTSQTPEVVAFKRNKILRFDGDGLHVDNQWIAQENLALQYVYAGMLSVNRYVSGISGTYLITGYHTDADFRLVDADTGTSPDRDITDVIISTIYGDAEIAMRYITGDQAYAASVSDFDTGSSQRLKVYAGLRNAQVTAGDLIRAEAIIRI